MLRRAIRLLTVLIAMTALYGHAGVYDLWNYRMTIRFKTPMAGILTNFPALIVLNTNDIPGFRYIDFAIPATGADLRFCSSNETTALNYEIEKWNTNGDSYAWVQVPRIASTSDFIYAYWGCVTNAAPCTTNGGTWSDGFVGVWHLATANDSSPSKYDGTVSGGASSVSTNGVLGNGWNFDGVDDAVQFQGLQWTPTRFSVSCWIKPDTLLNYNQVIGNNWGTFLVHTEAGGGLYIGTDVGTRFGPGDTGANVYQVGSWCHLTFTYDSGAAAVYKAGRRICAKTGMTAPTAWSGGFSLVAGSLDGVVDEVRVASVGLASNVVYATWLNQASNNVFITFSDVGPVATTLAVRVDSPTGIGLTNATMRGAIVHDGNGPNPRVYVCWDSTDKGTNSLGAWAHPVYLGTNWGRGQGFGTNITTLTSSTSYTYRCYVTNSTGKHWSPTKQTFWTLGLPAVTNTGATGIRFGSATLSGTLLSTGGQTTYVWFYYWTNTATVTSCVSMGPRTGSFGTEVSGLPVITAYSYRILASNSYGKAWSGTRAFTTWQPSHEWFVATNGTDGAGTNWATAFRTLSQALSASASNDAVYLAGHRFGLTNAVTWTRSHILIRGGHQATVATGAGSFDPDRWPTTLVRTGGTSRVLTAQSVTNGTIENVTLANGYAYLANGGGAALLNCTSLVLRRCNLTGNMAYLGADHVRGGGIYATNTYGTMDRCAVRDNRADSYDIWKEGLQGYGGGMYLQGGNWTIRHTVVANNKINDGPSSVCAAYGCGLAILGDATLENCFIVANSHRKGATDAWGGGGYGAGLYCGNGLVNLANCTLANNDSEGVRRGGGALSVRDSILWHNGADAVGTVTLQNCDVSDGTGAGVNGCFAADPRFERGMYLGAGSPCLDSGSRTAIAAGLQDRTTRTSGTADAGIVDIGYHHAQGVQTAYADFYVSGTGTNTAAGTNWVAAFRSIGRALSLARDGTRIHIGSGDYTNGLESFPLTLNRPGLQLLGTNRLSVKVNATGSSKSVFSLDGLCGDGRIEGIRISGGYPLNVDGGGLRIIGSDLALVDTLVTDNRAVNNLNYGRGYGAGIYSLASYVSMSNCEVYANYYVNAFWGVGGGMCLASGQWQVRDTVIKNNTASSWYESPYGGGIYVGGGTHTFVNSVIHGNDAGYADGLHVAGGSVFLTNCTVLANLGHGIYQSGGTVSARNSVLWGNGDDVAGTVSLAYCAVEDGDNNGTNGCIMADPLLEYGYYLAVGSPCRDAGDTNASLRGLDTYTTWRDGVKDTNRVDIGYHYRQGANMSLADLYVATWGSNTNGGTNAAAPFRTLTRAMAVAEAGSRIHVASGTYNMSAGETLPLVVSKAGIQILGTNRDTTVVTGENSARLLDIVNATGNRCVVRGMTLANGYGHKFGGGVHVDNALVTFDDCVVSGNRVHNGDSWGQAYGAGIYLKDSQVTVTNCLVRDNRFVSSPFYGYGGGIYASGGNVTISHTVVATNWVTSWYDAPYGGGIYLAGGTHHIENTLIVDNDATHADGVYVNASLTMSHVTLARNHGQGLRYGGGTIAATNCIFWGNTDDLVGFPYNEGELNPNFWYCLVGNGDNNGMQGCIAGNPLFADYTWYHERSRGGYYAGGYFSGGTWNGDAIEGPGIDAGRPSSAWQAEPQPNGRRANMGAYGNTIVASRTFLEEPGMFSNLTVHAYPASEVGIDYATLSAEVAHLGGAGDPRAFICWGTVDSGTGLPAAWQHNVDMGVRAQWAFFSTNITGLAAGTNYYRCCITNSAGGKDWSELVEFVTVQPPSVTNTGADAVRRRTAKLQGRIVETGGITPNAWFRYWLAGDTNTNVVVMGQQTGLFSTNIAGLAPSSNYQYRILASNSAGLVWSTTRSFTMLPATPLGWYVTTNGTGTAGTNWTTGMRTLYDAIATAERYDTICVAGHTFTINGPQFGASRQYDVSTSFLTIQGGYAATNDSDRPGVSDPSRWPTVLTRTNYGERVFYIHDCTGVVIRAVTVTGGRKHGTGGGMYFSKARASIDRCVIASNMVYNYDNWGAAYGAGIYVANSYLVFTNSVIQGNRPENSAFYGRGGGAYVDNGSVVFSHCAIVTNYTTSWLDSPYGGGLFLAGGTHRLENTLVADNHTTAYADGIYANAGLGIMNCTIAYNGGEGIRQAGGTVWATNSILWGNGDDIVGSVSLGYCDVENGDSAGVKGCFVADPLFADRLHYHVRSRATYYSGGFLTGGTWVKANDNSPCIDAGSPLSPYDREPYLNGSRINLGYDGNTPVASRSSIVGTILTIR